MIIGLYFNDKGFSGLDLRFPFKGNNGIGGTQYCFLMLAEALIRFSDHKIFFYHYNENLLPAGVNDRLINVREDILDYIVPDGIDIIIFKTEGTNNFVKGLSRLNVHAIAWAHNYIFIDEINEYYHNPSVSRVVFVSHEMYDRYIDHPIIQKSQYIFNMFDASSFEIRKVPECRNVTYTGSLVPAKGFHILAKAWKKILKEVPDAQLYIIGDGKLYDRNSELGDLGIANKSYEKLFTPYISEDGHILESVHFCGSLGIEKLEIYNKTTVGVMNPSGRTETFGLSAVEMSACGIPVITKKANGLLDTVIDGKTGYLISSERELASKIIRVLKDSELNHILGCEGKRFVESSFLPEKLVQDWLYLFTDVMSNNQCCICFPTRNLNNGFKWLRICNFILQKFGIKTKSIIEIECKLKAFLHH